MCRNNSSIPTSSSNASSGPTTAAPPAGPDRLNSADSPIRAFYEGKNVFITGATGFVGKFIVEKLLRSTNVNAIYILIRPKRGLSPAERAKEYFNSQFFSLSGHKYPFQKVRPLEGDILKPKLGLSEADQEELIRNVHIVFHSAASVKFNDSLK